MALPRKKTPCPSSSGGLIVVRQHSIQPHRVDSHGCTNGIVKTGEISKGVRIEQYDTLEVPPHHAAWAISCEPLAGSAGHFRAGRAEWKTPPCTAAMTKEAWERGPKPRMWPPSIRQTVGYDHGRWSAQ